MTTPTRDSTSGIGPTLRDMWATRPARDPDDRVIAGVSAAVARRYAIDPTLVRVVFVVSAFYGVGLLLYFVGWLVLPDRTRPRHTPVVVTIVAVLLGIATIGGLTRGTPPVLLGLLLAAALLYALHVNRAALGAPGARDVAGAAASGEGATVAVAAGPPPPPRSPLAPITLAAALVVAGVVLAAGLLGWVPLGVTPVVGAALAVVGVGLVVGAFVGAGRSLVLAAIPLALVLVAAAAAPPWDDDDGRFGAGWDRDGTSRAVEDAGWAPQSAAAVAPAYRTGVGSAQLDLRALPPGPLPPGPPVATTVDSGVGDVTVLVGPTADVTVDCATGAGDVRCLGRTGVGRVVDLGVDGPGGPQVTLRAQSGAGDVEVRRG